MTFVRVMRVMLTCIFLALALAFCGCSEVATQAPSHPCTRIETTTYLAHWRAYPPGCSIYLTPDGGR